MEISIFDFIKSASDETLMKMAELTQAEQQERKAQKEEAEQKYYTFSGTWSWGCWAANKEEAKNKFDDEAYSENFEIDYDHIQIDVDDF